MLLDKKMTLTLLWLKADLINTKNIFIIEISIHIIQIQQTLSYSSGTT